MKRLLTALAFTTIMSGSALAADKMTVMLDWFANPDHGPLVLAQELGYFEEAGLDVELIAPSDPNDPPRMAAAGKVDIAVSYQPQLHLSRHSDLPLARVGTLVATPLTCLVALADGPVKNFSDLKGRKIGIAVAGVQEMLLDAMLKHNGLTANDVEQILVGFSISPSLRSGQVAGVIGAFRNFELNQLKIEDSEGRCFYPEAEGVPAYDELIYVADPAQMDKDKVSRFLSATERAVMAILNDPAGSWKTFAATSSELQTELNEKAWADTWPRFATRPAALDAGRYARFENFLLEQGAITTKLKVSDLAIDVNAD